jgi:hypothetical protein
VTNVATPTANPSRVSVRKFANRKRHAGGATLANVLSWRARSIASPYGAIVTIRFCRTATTMAKPLSTMPRYARTVTNVDLEDAGIISA